MAAFNSEQILPVAERRHYARFAATLRVAYRVGKGWQITTSMNLSQGGMRLAAAPDLVSGDETSLRIDLEDGHRPVAALGRVLASDTTGARVAFQAGQTKLQHRIRHCIETAVLPKLEASLSEIVRDRNRLLTLAFWYEELGRQGPAFELWRGALDAARARREDLESVAPLVLRYGGRLGSKARPLLRELHETVVRALAEMPSPVLEGVRQAIPPPLERNLRRSRSQPYPPLFALLRPKISEAPRCKSALGPASIAAQLASPRGGRHGSPTARSSSGDPSYDRPRWSSLAFLGALGVLCVALALIQRRGERQTPPVLPAAPPPSAALAPAGDVRTGGLAVASSNQIESLLPKTPGDPRLAAGWSHLRAGNAAMAAAAAQAALANEPGSAEAHHLLGVALLRLARYDEAWAALRAFVRLAPDDPSASVIRELLGPAVEGAKAPR